MNIKLLAATAALALAAPAFATNLVTNGDFGTGDFTGFTQFGNTGFTGVSGGSAFFGPVGSTGGIAQTLSNAAGTYTISFDLQHDGGTTNSAAVVFGATTLLTLSDAPGFGFTHYTFYGVAGAGNDQLSFTFRQDPAYYRLDNVSVAVPEPATWALMIGGFAMTGFAMRRRKVALAA